MKTGLFSLLLGLMTCLTALGQNTVDLTITYNQTSAQYEVYAIPTFTNSQFLLGDSQITVVLSASAVGNVPLSVTSVGGGVWTDNQDAFAPSAAPQSDFHAVATVGAGGNYILNFTAGTPALLFTFKLPEGCVQGVRLFNNTSDPQSSVITGGGDYRNNFFGTSTVATGELYRTNTNNNGTGCTTCNLAAPTLSK